MNISSKARPLWSSIILILVLSSILLIPITKTSAAIIAPNCANISQGYCTLSELLDPNNPGVQMIGPGSPTLEFLGFTASGIDEDEAEGMKVFLIEGGNLARLLFVPDLENNPWYVASFNSESFNTSINYRVRGLYGTEIVSSGLGASFGAVGGGGISYADAGVNAYLNDPFQITPSLSVTCNEIDPLSCYGESLFKETIFGQNQTLIDVQNSIFGGFRIAFAGGGRAEIWNFSQSLTSTVPEPATLFLTGLGLAALGARRRGWLSKKFTAPVE